MLHKTRARASRLIEDRVCRIPRVGREKGRTTQHNCGMKEDYDVRLLAELGVSHQKNPQNQGDIGGLGMEQTPRWSAIGQGVRLSAAERQPARAHLRSHNLGRSPFASDALRS